MRAKIILQLNEGMPPTDVATARRTPPKTVDRWRSSFEQEGIEGLHERARSGRPTLIEKGIITLESVD
ncbi:helix-turn-helix domain-containing protein [Microbulbifer sp. JMSA004]|uniref:helix-turn-helix domain-containing protein n=1 Tax=Microbulbifer sp. JMSA004 TaxID=3243370 RepID=UPI004039E9D3